MVIRECVADRTAAVLEANLFDLQQKYAEIVSFSDALAYLAVFQPSRMAIAFSRKQAC